MEKFGTFYQFSNPKKGLIEKKNLPYTCVILFVLGTGFL
jgi:hypothetical protein